MLRAAAATLARDFKGGSSSAELKVAGIGLLLAGQTGEAVKTLQRAAMLHPHDGGIWNDLAAARLAMYEEGEDASQLVDALGDIDCALRADRGYADSLFNRAQILEVMGLDAAATNAYTTYLSADSESGWASEARRHRDSLAIDTTADTWDSATKRLREASAANDLNAVRALVAKYPQDARANGETRFLSEWATGILDQDGQAAETALQLAGYIGEALLKVNGEALLHDAVAAIRAEKDPDNRRRLAQAHSTYDRARQLYGTQHRAVTEALPQFAAAAETFRRAGSPMAQVTDFYFASSLYDMNRRDEAKRILQSLDRAAQPSYKALRAFVQWQIGSIHSRDHKLQEALDAQLRATSLFEQLGEYGNANVIGSAAAATQSVIGRRGAAWKTRIAIFHRMSRSGDPADLQRALDVTARAEALSEAWPNTYSLLTLALDSHLQQNPRVYVSSLIWHALAAYRLGISGIVEADLATARIASGQIRDGTMRNQAKNDLVFCAAVTARATHPILAITLLNHYIDESRHDGRVFLLSEALLERGRAKADTGDDVNAIRDFTESLQLNRNASDSLLIAQMRDAYFRTGDSAARELAGALIRMGRIEEALVLIDGERTRPYGPATHVEGKQFCMPSGATLLEYLALSDRLLIFVRTERRMRLVQISIGVKKLDEAAAAFLREIDTGESGDALNHLSTILIAPIRDDILQAKRLIIVPDRTIAMVPFAALRLRSNQFLVQHISVTVSPSAAVAADRSRSRDVVPSTLLAVGNPAIDEKRFPGLKALTASEREVRRISREYPRSTILVGAAATRAAVLDALASSDAVHIATHAVVIRADPARSHIILAPATPDSGVLYLADVDRAVLQSPRLVVLAACDTATPPDVRRNIDTLALAFVAGGASNVIGTLWHVDDEATEEFSVLLHHQIRRGVSPAQAVRDAQLAMLGSSRPAFRAVSAWGGFQVYGSGE